MNLNPLLHHRILFLSAPISAASVNPIIAELLLLNAEAPGKQIDLYINSPGGSVLDGLALIDAIQCIETRCSSSPQQFTFLPLRLLQGNLHIALFITGKAGQIPASP